MHATTRALIVGGALALAAACAPTEDTTPVPEIGVPAPVEDISLVHLPIEDYMLTPTESIERDYVVSVLVSDCMRGFGIDYPPGARPAPDGSSAATYSVLFRRYGVTDAESVRVWGYHVPRPTVPAGAGKKGKTGALSPVDRRVLTGTDTSPGPLTHAGRPVPPGGCLAEGERGVRDGADASPQGPESSGDGLVAAIKSDSFHDSMADPRVTTVFGQWSACMAAHGYQVDQPLDAVGGPSLDDPTPSRAEITKAETDVTCKEQTNLVGVWFAVESAYQDIAIDHDAERLGTIRGERDALAARIHELYDRYAR